MTPTKTFSERLRRVDPRLGVKWDPAERGGRWFMYRINVREADYAGKEEVWRGKTARQQFLLRNGLFREHGELCKFLWWVEGPDGEPWQLDERVFDQIAQFDLWRRDIKQAVEASAERHGKVVSDEAKRQNDARSDVAWPFFKQWYDANGGGKTSGTVMGKHFDAGARSAPAVAPAPSTEGFVRKGSLYVPGA